MDSRQDNAESIGVLPVLVTATWCPFTATAASFWGDATESVGLPLRVVDLAADEGEQLARAARLQGVPCLMAPGAKLHSGARLHYGLGLSHEQAVEFLGERQACQ
jgi:hypothetical protein